MVLLGSQIFNVNFVKAIATNFKYVRYYLNILSLKRVVWQSVVRTWYCENSRMAKQKKSVCARLLGIFGRSDLTSGATCSHIVSVNLAIFFMYFHHSASREDHLEGQNSLWF